MNTKQKYAVTLVRSIMRLDGKTQVWNNRYVPIGSRYDNGIRTVKCYRDKDTCKDLALKDTIVQTLKNLNVEHEVRFTLPAGNPLSPSVGGFIVQLQA